MNDAKAGIVVQFIDAMTDCKRLYVQAAQASLENQPRADEKTRRDLIRRMVDLHKGLLVKIYATIAKADSRWSRMERELARELIDQLWHRRPEDAELKEIAARLFEDAGSLTWYGLLRPFDRVHAIRDMVPELETVVLRIANLVAKADGTVTTSETDALHGIQQEIDVHLHRISLGDDPSPEGLQHSGEKAAQIIHQETQRLQERTQSETESGRILPTTPEAKTLRPSDTVDEQMEELQDTLEKTLADLEQLVGLTRVKKEIETLTNYLNLQQHRQAAGLPQHQLSLHMVFNGNPGTGKTTVARIVGRIFRALGLLNKGHLVETDRSGLVAEFAGQTGPKTNRKIDEALIDGILFVDEAYSLVTKGQEDAYGLEAIQALVKRMEDDRNRLVVILAGYPDPMADLLRSNPGLSSRFNTQMLFEDFSPVDLGRIYQLMSQANHYEIPADTRAKLLLGFQWLYEQRDEHFGNGRLVRNTFENSVRKLANRIASIAPVTKELLTVLTIEDVDLRSVPQEIWSPLGKEETRFTICCQHCSKSAQVRTSFLGKKVRCPKCQTDFEADWGLPVKP